MICTPGAFEKHQEGNWISQSQDGGWADGRLSEAVVDVPAADHQPPGLPGDSSFLQPPDFFFIISSSWVIWNYLSQPFAPFLEPVPEGVTSVKRVFSSCTKSLEDAARWSCTVFSKFSTHFFKIRTCFSSTHYHGLASPLALFWSCSLGLISPMQMSCSTLYIGSLFLTHPAHLF